MKTKYLFILLLIVVQLSSNCQTTKFNGVSFVASRDQINETHISPVLKVKSNAVALMPFGFIRNLETPTITHNSERQWFGETKAGLLQYAKAFKKHNVKIMVKPQIWVWRGEFTGNIKMNSEENWKTLEDS